MAIFVKIASDKIQEKAIAIFFTTLFCFLILLPIGITKANQAFFMVGIIGMMDVIGSCFYWQIVNMNLSKSSLFVPLGEITSIILAIIFLNEGGFWNFQLIIGAGLCFLAIYLFSLPKNKKDANETALKRKWVLYLAFSLIIFGVVDFLITKTIISSNINAQDFLISWFGSSFLTSSAILFIKKQNPFKLPSRTLWIIAPVVMSSLLVMFATFYTFGAKPLSLVLPLRSLATTLIPILAGWIIFKEREKFSKNDWLGFFFGIMGAILVLLH